MIVLENFINLIGNCIPLFNEIVMPIFCMAIVVTVPCILHKVWK